jgi:hypothetical protein
MKFTSLVLLVGCTHWNASPVYGPRAEIGRRLVGAPQIEETTSSSMEAGFGGVTTEHAYAGGIAGSHDSVKRTHCVQQAQIDYAQEYDLVPAVERRPLDVAGSVMLGLAGLAIVGFAQAKYNSDQSFYQMDPSFFAQPSAPTGAYVVGGGMMAGAAGWMIYSLTSLPKGSRPAVEHQRRSWTETTYVEATGCGLVPGDR